MYVVDRWIQFTSEREWRPYDDKFKLVEDAMINHNVTLDLDHQHDPSVTERIGMRSVGRVSVASLDDKVTDNDPSLYTFDSIYNNNLRDIKMISSRNQRSKVNDGDLV